MILTQCVVCATDLGLSLGKKCGRCSTRYCGPECQVQHWKEGGHDNLCKKIKKAGGAEQYNANNKYKEAVAVAVEKCADDTKGQTCYICTQALHWKTKEGLVRGCSCRGTAGFAHVSCLVEQAKILFAEAEEDNLGFEVLDERLKRWYMCSLCKQSYHGVVSCALAWACWKTYLGRPEGNGVRRCAMNQLGVGLSRAEHHEEALTVKEAELFMDRRLGASEQNLISSMSNIAVTYSMLGRFAEASDMHQDVYFGYVRLHGEEHINAFQAASNYADSLLSLRRFEETKALLRKTMPMTRRVLGDENILTLRMKKIYAEALYMDHGATLDDLREAVTTLEDAERTARRVLGGAHPSTMGIEENLRESRAALGARETPEAEKLAQDAFRTARAKIAQERSELADAMAVMTTGDA